VPPSRKETSGGIDLNSLEGVVHTNNKTKSVGERHEQRVQQQEQENKTCVLCTRRKGGLMSDKNNTDSSVAELRGNTYSTSKLGSQVDIFVATTRAIGEYVGREFGHKMRMLVLYGKEPSIVPQTLDATATKQDVKMKWNKDYDVFIKKKTKYASA
jgi:hypothetical protein